MDRNKRFSGGGRIFLFLSALLLVPALVSAAQPRDYTYIVLRGELADPDKKKPMAQATIRLMEILPPDSEAQLRYFEAVTNEEGKFEFPRLPLADFQLEIETAEGELIRSLASVDLDDPDQTRLKLKISERVVSDARMDTGSERFVISVDVEATKWKKFWMEAGIFVVGAGVLAAGI
jgi:hypothetical protein